MTGRATFGDFAGGARALLRGAAGPPDLAPGCGTQAARAGPVREFTHSMDRVVTVMARYATDITAVLAPEGSPEENLPGTWPHASLQARQAIQNAAAFLQPIAADTGPPSHQHTVDPTARRLDAATAVLAAGSDLLHTHVAARSDGTRVDRSEWAPVMTSPPVARALLLELGLWARRIATQGTRLALPGPAARRGTGEERHRLNTACQWLWVLDSAVQAAQRHHPVSAAEVQLLHAIPINDRAPRRIPGPAETVTTLCQGTINSAERVRHAATISAPDPAWSPALTADSLRQAAACGTVISHHCELLLQTLATRASQHGSTDLAAQLLGRAEAAAHARAAWLRAARAWHRITTDTRGTITPAAAEVADLALWTGRLAYADPTWTPALGPSHATSTPETLAPEPRDIADVIAAVHQATKTLTRIAQADHNQIRAAAQAGRLLVPTRSLPDRFDIPHPFAPALADRVDALLAAYDHAAARSAQATNAVATIAADIRSHSRILTLADAAIRDASEVAGNGSRSAEPVPEPDLASGSPGPVERILHDLGVTSPAMLERASAIDQLGEQLILDATQVTDPQQSGLQGIDLSRSGGSAELINHMLASGNPCAAAILRPPSPPARRFTEENPHPALGDLRHTGHQNAWQIPEAEAEP